LIRAAIYCRASKNNYVLASDRERGEAFAREQGLEIVDTVTDIGSRPVLERPGIRRLLGLASSRKIDVIVADSMFTFSGFRATANKLEDYLALLDELQEYDVHVQLLDSG
jgi:DNA invertase Pin-like site-specific DNA recombinase